MIWKITNTPKHLTTREVEKLPEAARGSRFEARGRCLLPMMVPTAGFAAIPSCVQIGCYGRA